MAPEVYEDYEIYSEKSFVWSLGCVMAFYLNCGRHVFFTAEDVNSYIGQGFIIDFVMFEKYSADLLELVFKMINPDEDEILTAKEVHEETTLFDRTERGSIEKNTKYVYKEQSCLGRMKVLNYCHNLSMMFANKKHIYSCIQFIFHTDSSDCQ